MLENSNKIIVMAMESLFGLMGRTMKDNGKMD